MFILDTKYFLNDALRYILNNLVYIQQKKQKKQVPKKKKLYLPNCLSNISIALHRLEAVSYIEKEHQNLVSLLI